MSIELSHNVSTGTWSFSYKRHIFVALGLLLVGSGLATFTGPWWQGILIAALGKAGVVVNESYQWQLAAAQIIPGLGLLAYKHFIVDPRQAKIRADKSTFLTANISIERARYYLSNLLDDHSYTSRLHSEFYEVWTRFLKPEFVFQHHSTATAYREFSLAAGQLEEFVGTNFFVFPNIPPADRDYRYCLAPHLNMDRELVAYDAEKVAEYRALSTQLHEKTKQVQTLFTKWIEDLKTLGHV